MSATLLLSAYGHDANNSTIGYLLQSLDSGATWAHRADIESQLVSDGTVGGRVYATHMVASPDGQHVILYADHNGSLYSGDSGKTFVALTDLPTGMGTQGMRPRWVNNQFVYAMHDGNTTFYASPTGAPGTWVQKGSPLALPTYGIGYAGGRYFYTSDHIVNGGNPLWTSTDLMTCTADPNHPNGPLGGTGSNWGYWAATADGSVLLFFTSKNNSGSYNMMDGYSTDGGVTFHALTAYSDLVWAPQGFPCGDDSRFYMAINDGIKWFDPATLSEGSNHFLANTQMSIGGAAYAAGVPTVITSRNTDSTLYAYTSTDLGASFTQLAQIDPTTLYFGAVLGLDPAPVAFWQDFAGAKEYV